MFFISGITGHVGGAAARDLLADGHRIRTLARDPAKAAAWSAQGVEVQRGDLLDPEALAAAMRGAEGVYLMMPPFHPPSPGHTEAKAIVASFRTALAQVPPQKLVVLSSIGSQRRERLGNIMATALLEQSLEGAAFPITYVRAGSFYENYEGSFRGARATGFFDTFFTPTDRPVPMIGSRDIGREVARRLVATWSGHRVVELGSDHSPDEVARAMASALGREVRARAIPRSEWTARLEAFGMAPGTTWAFEEMEDGFNSGWIAFGDPGAERVAATLTPAEFFASLRPS